MKRVRKAVFWFLSLWMILFVLVGCGGTTEGMQETAKGKENVRTETIVESTVAEMESSAAASALTEETDQEEPDSEEGYTDPEEIAAEEGYTDPEEIAAEESYADPEKIAAEESYTDSEEIATEEGYADPEEMDPEGVYTDKESVARYLHIYGRLPDNYITKKEAQDLGWDSKAGNLWDVAPGKSIGGSRFGNYEKQLPEKKGRKYFECDIDYEGGYRGAKRLIYSNDGLIFYTEDHYKSFEQLY